MLRRTHAKQKNGRLCTTTHGRLAPELVLTTPATADETSRSPDSHPPDNPSQTCVRRAKVATTIITMIEIPGLTGLDRQATPATQRQPRIHHRRHPTPPPPVRPPIPRAAGDRFRRRAIDATVTDHGEIARYRSTSGERFAPAGVVAAISSLKRSESGRDPVLPGRLRLRRCPSQREASPGLRSHTTPLETKERASFAASAHLSPRAGSRGRWCRGGIRASRLVSNCTETPCALGCRGADSVARWGCGFCGRGVLRCLSPLRGWRASAFYQSRTSASFGIQRHQRRPLSAWSSCFMFSSTSSNGTVSP